ncbi:MAG: 30S ribosomal protein S6 [Crocinitomicaceae bacterium]|nr:30S ribosomal protein S6 [Crocinitomicaceae bacterium]|tara:strand:+ start:4724 stop:5089 length:366 start_codon:yes stop_codon:yes gene_type:complete
MVNSYETVFILTPVLSEDQVKEAVKKVEATLKGQKAKIIHRENWGLKKLAYPIQKKSTGFYNLLQFEAEGSCIERLEIEMKRDERIMRFLTVKMDKHALAFAESRRMKNKNAEKAAPEAEA